MTNAKKTAIKLRWLLLTLWVLCLLEGLVWIFCIYFDFGAGLAGAPLTTFLGPFGRILDGCTLDSWLAILILLIYPAMFFFTQWLFLAPRKLWKIKTTATSRPMKKAAIAAAFAIALLSAGLIYSILDLFSVEIPDSPSDLSGYLLVSIPLILWLFWSVIFCVYYRTTNYNTWASRILRALIAGSILELFISIPIFVTRQEECYCARPSYAGIVFSSTILLWAFGPALFLLFLKQKNLIEKLDETKEP